MQLCDDVELRPTARDPAAPSELLIAGHAMASRVSGRVLEAALRCAPGWLVFATDDTPYEEMLAIHLVGLDGRLLDSARIGGPYTSGSFTQLRLEPPATAHFRFIDDADWSVQVWERPRFVIPFLPDARGVWRGARSTRHFKLSRRPA